MDAGSGVAEDQRVLAQQLLEGGFNDLPSPFCHFDILSAQNPENESKSDTQKQLVSEVPSPENAAPSASSRRQASVPETADLFMPPPPNLNSPDEWRYNLIIAGQPRSLPAMSLDSHVRV